MKSYIFIVFIVISFVSCKNKTESDEFVLTPIYENFSSIIDPRERWEAYNLKKYTIHQGWTCECLPPYNCESFVVNGEIDAVSYDIIEDSYHGRSDQEIYYYVKNKSMSVNEAFELIDHYKNTAYEIKVSYNSRYGYPAKIYIDIDSSIVDEEIIHNFSKLNK